MVCTSFLLILLLFYYYPRTLVLFLLNNNDEELLFLFIENVQENIKVAENTQFNSFLEQRPLAFRVRSDSLLVICDVGDVIRWSLRLWHYVIKYVFLYI